MKPRKVTLVLEVTTGLPLSALRKTRFATLFGPVGRAELPAVERASLGVVEVQQATASVVQPVTTTTKKGAKGGNAK